MGGLADKPGTPERATRAVAEADAAERAKQLTEDPSKALLRWIAKLGAGIVSGLGLTGVIGLIGSAVLWQRFEEAGLPATQSLAVVPEDQRVIEGATGSAGALLIGALAVAVLFSLDRGAHMNLWSKIAIGLLLVVGAAYAVSTELPAGAVALLILLAVVLAGVSVGVAKVTGDRFVPFALAIFVSTVIFSGAITYAIAADQDFVQPAAVLRSAEGQGIRGFYVADDDEFIYIGVIRADFAPDVEEDPGSPEAAVPLYRIPRTADTRLLIGRPQEFDDAVAEAEDLRQQLKETRPITPQSESTAPLGG